MLYPNKFIALDEKRIFVYNTLFNLPEIYLLAAIIDYFAKHPEYKEVKEGFKWKDLLMSYTSIFQVGIFKKICNFFRYSNNEKNCFIKPYRSVELRPFFLNVFFPDRVSKQKY